MLQVNVAQLLKAQVGTSKSFEVNDNIKFEDGESAVKGKIELIRTNQGLLVKGKVSADIEVECCRCLNKFSCNAETSFEEEAYPSVDILSGYDVKPPEESSSMIIDEHHTLDVEDIIRQYLLLEIPMKPICSENCKGIQFSK